jgi:hypothetical protein
MLSWLLLILNRICDARYGNEVIHRHCVHQQKNCKTKDGLGILQQACHTKRRQKLTLNYTGYTWLLHQSRRSAAMFSLTRESDVSGARGTRHTESSPRRLQPQSCLSTRSHVMVGRRRADHTYSAWLQMRCCVVVVGESRGLPLARGKWTNLGFSTPALPKYGEHNYCFHPHDTIRFIFPGFAVCAIASL